MGTDKFLYKYLSQYGPKASFAALQADLRPGAEDKLPSFAEKACYYTRRSLEQSTAERVAVYKSMLFQGPEILVLAAGLGVDDWAFSYTFGKVVSVDPDEELNKLSRYNFDLLGRHNIERVTGYAETCIKNKGPFSYVYIDPDRRDNVQRQILLSDHQPNVMALMSDLVQITRHLLVKCSPMYDHEMALREIKGITDIYIISYKGEVKEMLLSADLKTDHTTYTLHCVELDRDKELSVSFPQDQLDKPAQAETIAGYFYEASSGIIKVRKHHDYASMNGLMMIDRGVPFYCSTDKTEPFAGRCLKIVHAMPFHAAECSRYLNTGDILKANVKVRGLKFNTAEALKKLKLKEGGDDYLFIFPFRGKSWMAHCRY
jgi:hypothetical protein